MVEKKRDICPIENQTIVVILAAGKGTRMGRSDIAKVCFEIDGVPAINRTIDTFKGLGFSRFVVVVGSKAEHVMDTVSAGGNSAIYVCQQPQLGTGHAARMVGDALQKIGYQQNILVTMGDKFIDTQAIKALVDGYQRQQADLALLTIPKRRGGENPGGRVFIDDDGQALDIIEQMDIARQAIGDRIAERLEKSGKISQQAVGEIIKRYIPIESKQQRILPELVKWVKSKKSTVGVLKKIIASDKFNLRIKGEKYTAEQIEKCCGTLNPSLYLFNADAFYTSLSMLKNDNAQGEYYLTDVVKHLSASENPVTQKNYRVRTVLVDDPGLIQGFNSPDELLAIQDYIRKRKGVAVDTVRLENRPRLSRKQYRTVAEWIKQLDSFKPSMKKWFVRIYGQHEQLHRDKCHRIKNVLNCYGKRFGFDQKVCIVRAPGRLNLMGRHVDHRGGFNNFLAIDRETIAVAGLREDDNVVAVNSEPRKFKTVRFNISELIGSFAWSDWMNFVNSDWVRNMLYSNQGDWGNYIKAAILRLQHKFENIKIRGVNLAVTGDIPIAAGLSSSSSLVVASLQAAIALNNFELTSQQFIDLCGEGEWFVGSRGGAGDHAAIYLGQRGKIAQVANLPFGVENVIDAPDGYQLVIANSHIKAPKSAAAKDKFNSRIASYNLGLALFKQRCPEIADLVEYVRDIDPQKTGCRTSDIYRYLMKVPQYMTRKDFRAMLSKEHKELIERNFATHGDPGRYNVRGVLLFGAAEVMRSKICVDYLKTEVISEFGKLMKISHDGDRVSRCDKDGSYKICECDCDDNYLNQLIVDLGSEDPLKVLNSQLYMQPGYYACSTPQIDMMVDIACSVTGVVGAQIAGAGLGGCIMILAKKSSIPDVKRALIRGYYKPNKLKPAIIPCLMVEGAGLAEF